MDYQEIENAAKTKALEIAAVMGYEIDESWDAYGTMIKKGVISLHISSDRYKTGRLRISGNLAGMHPYLPYQSDTDEISVNINKSPESIARDIERRCLPIYLKNLEDATAARIKDIAFKARRAEVLLEIAALIPGAEVRNLEDQSSYSSSQPVISSYGPYCCKATYSGYDGEKIKLEIELPLDVARKILAPLKE